MSLHVGRSGLLATFQSAVVRKSASVRFAAADEQETFPTSHVLSVLTDSTLYARDDERSGKTTYKPVLAVIRFLCGDVPGHPALLEHFRRKTARLIAAQREDLAPYALPAVSDYINNDNWAEWLAEQESRLGQTITLRKPYPHELNPAEMN